ncbi:RNase H family protein [Vibrio algivorus]|nr:RNase H family protein [Vibrio algivorus]
MNTKSNNTLAQSEIANTTPLSRSIYCDGSAPNNQGSCTKGGYGVVIYDHQQNVLEEYGKTVSDKKVTNVKMEMMAFALGLHLSKAGDTIFSDSKMVVDSYNKWLDGWKKQGWKKSDKKTPENLDLWLVIDELKPQRKGVTVKHVKSHCGIVGNEHADRLATNAAKGLEVESPLLEEEL